MNDEITLLFNFLICDPQFKNDCCIANTSGLYNDVNLLVEIVQFQWCFHSNFSIFSINLFVTIFKLWNSLVAKLVYVWYCYCNNFKVCFRLQKYSMTASTNWKLILLNLKNEKLTNLLNCLKQKKINQSRRKARKCKPRPQRWLPASSVLI